jgi:Alternative complex III, ActD subunit
MKPKPAIHGLMIEFLTAKEILDAARRARQAGYRDMDAYTPYPVDGLAVELGMRRTRIPFVVLMGGLIGAGVGFLMQYYSMAINYTFNSGGRPYNSWPVFIPITFELLILVGAFAAFLGMMFLNGLPRPNHPVFNVPQFGRSSQDRFFLCIEATDPRFDRQGTAEFLAKLDHFGDVIEVPNDQQ